MVYHPYHFVGEVMLHPVYIYILYIYIYTYTIWRLNLIAFSEKDVFSSVFFSRRTAYIVRDNAKNLYQ